MIAIGARAGRSYILEIFNIRKLLKYNSLLSMRYDDLVSTLRGNRINYFVWEAKAWKNAGYAFPQAVQAKDFRELNRWEEEQLILYRVL